MENSHITAQAHPNIAFIKYWGNANSRLRLPSNSSLSMNLGSLVTTTTVSANTKTQYDVLSINGIQQTGEAVNRLQAYLNFVRQMYACSEFINVKSSNNFPMAVGIASSASAYAALAKALDHFFKLDLEEKEISALARLGSGSACRSIPGGFCEWEKGRSHASSYAVTIASENHWDLYDCILVISQDPKKVSSTQGHSLADSSPLQSVRVHDTLRRLAICRDAVLKRDFEKLAYIIELDSNMMHAVMMTSDPPIMYWQPTSIAIMHTVKALRQKGTACAYTMDAGANVHVICTVTDLPVVKSSFESFPRIENIFVSKVGGSAKVL